MTLLKKKNYFFILAILTSLLFVMCNENKLKPIDSLTIVNKEKTNFNLVKQLDTIYRDDQFLRMQGEENADWNLINYVDKINQNKVKTILDKYGWLGPEIIGKQGNATLFLVIQHSDLATQIKYLPMMQDAVKNHIASPSSLALLEDRINLGNGKRQIYGSQIGTNPETKLNYVLPLEDPDNVDKRRAEVGLEPLADYVIYWKIIWNVKQYKKDLPILEAKEKQKRR
jgi:hypothetical protein